MNQYKVKQYQKEDYKLWNDFISQAKNATFLFHRDFMEYHQDRFEDFSLLVFDKEKLVAVMPANRVGAVVHSHQGLTYGGLVYGEDLMLSSVINVFRTLLLYLNEKSIFKCNIKLLPSIYHLKPAEELNYALFLVEAQLIRRDSMSVIDLTQNYSFSKIRKRGIQKAIKNKLVIKEEMDFASFWNSVLIPNLESKHQTKPVHSVEEISQLKRLFPKNIHQFNVYSDNQIVAGTTVFETESSVHCQYISKLEKEGNLGSLDFLYNFLIRERFNSKRFFDFGISNEKQGRKLNEGLSYWKESFGASTIVHDFYEVETSKFYLLENVAL
ncbi:GNAT family N-acetyltransferase [Flavobacterium sp. NG2]|uniref:GNAT family N-acetyltransferase n=1 Tax=Flavobacterium sp. NG2 TaxID=3097547 RepID=UPI002A830B23|nr:GNAT family N-acetyltransferase [Flavobacterium sp. NG2]WPR70194.1 GNAT family N-acetyltransferase [Flavobacterium sp. NG2]